MILDNNTMEMMKMATITPAEFAVEVDSDGRTVRKFLRSVTPKDEQPGKGSRWALPGTKRDITRMKKQFAEWTAKQDEARAKRESEKAEVETEEVEETEEPVELDD
jgi:hypothetical protein